MANYNKVILVGNLTRDPQMRFLPSQTAVVDFGIAVNRRWKSPDGQQKEEVMFIDCSVFGKQAETLNQYVKKGNPILIEGQLRLDRWEGKDGSKHSKHKVAVERFQFLGGPPGAGQRQQPAAPAQQQAQPSAAAEEPPPMMEEPPAGGDDIPF